MPAKIKALPPLLVNQIAAGEVIERPASVVKELCENALDAGAKRLSLELQSGGIDLIRLSDDGHGIAPEDLELAVSSHATSKLSEADDLFRIASFGFRGEALASIGAVSHLSVVSAPSGQDEGGRITVEGGQIGAVKVAPTLKGTVITVRNLFFNVPARRKFLKRASTELSHITESLNRLALAHPEVGFYLKHDGRQLLSWPACENVRQRLAQVFSKELAQEALHVHDEGLGLHFEAYVAPPSFNRHGTKKQYLFLNGRWIRDRQVQFAVKDVFHTLAMEGRHPVWCLYLTVDPQSVDVNVHPAKTEVRFKDARAVTRLIRSALHRVLENQHFRAVMPAPNQGSNLSSPTMQPPSSNQNWGESFRGTTFDSFQDSQTPQGLSQQQFFEQREYYRHEKHQPQVQTADAPGGVKAFMQIHNSYIVVATDQGFEVIDQHALHERVLHEKLLKTLQAGQVESQRLLMPQVIPLDPPILERVLQAEADLQAAGFSLAAGGEDALVVSALPVMMAPEQLPDFFRHLLDEQADLHLDASSLQERAAALTACKSAVKAGDPLSPEDIESLLKSRAETPRYYACEHGRPTHLSFSLVELEKRFGRR